MVDAIVVSWLNIEKKRMFGGICYLTCGNICFGIWQDYLIIRAGVDVATEMLKVEHVRPFDIIGKPMKGWFMVAEGGWQREEELRDWLFVGREFAGTLPAK